MIPLILSPEICSLICTSPLLPHSDILVLCHVSRSFRAEAELILCTSINLPVPSIRALNSWHTFLARRPHSNHFPHHVLPNKPPHPGPPPLCINLRDLTMLDALFRERSPSIGSRGTDLHPPKFYRHPFHHNMLNDFLESQKSLTTFSHRPSSTHVIDGTRLPHKETLPNLTTLDTSAAIVRELAQADMESWKTVKPLQYFLE